MAALKNIESRHSNTNSFSGSGPRAPAFCGLSRREGGGRARRGIKGEGKREIERGTDGHLASGVRNYCAVGSQIHVHSPAVLLAVIVES
jgi:hypothetical protein